MLVTQNTDLVENCLKNIATDIGSFLGRYVVVHVDKRTARFQGHYNRNAEIFLWTIRCKCAAGHFAMCSLFPTDEINFKKVIMIIYSQLNKKIRRSKIIYGLF